MRTVREAIGDILERIAPLGSIEQVRLESAAGRVLARDVRSDVDMPPFEKSAVDGFAVRSADFAAGPRALKQVGESKAGTPFVGRIAPGECVAIYTGAEVPPDCDAVVMVEKSAIAGTTVTLDDQPQRGQHVCHRGEDVRVDEIVLAAGKRLTPIDLSVLSAVGCEPVPVTRRPRVALITTGDELVAPHVKPGPGQIREGNTFYLAARARAAGAEVLNLGVLPDDEVVLEQKFREVLAACDVVMTTGGVSMGKYDLVGAVFERCAVEPVFHKVAIKPGKPLWFGMHGKVSVFGLPGNPVSCLIGFEVFVRPALAKLEGASAHEWTERLRIGRWRGGATKENPRQQNLPVRIEPAADGHVDLVPLEWTSSADIVELSRAQALAVIEPYTIVTTGELLPYRRL
ncbi:MAG: molybdopterin molybdotransferase MoeA [Planctomycetes bacterium]|nr:molybdopterin molybdotransferase MoeA [Planctomycetota bacterium]